MFEVVSTSVLSTSPARAEVWSDRLVVPAAQDRGGCILALAHLARGGQAPDAHLVTLFKGLHSWGIPWPSPSSDHKPHGAGL